MLSRELAEEIQERCGGFINLGDYEVEIESLPIHVIQDGEEAEYDHLREFLESGP